MKIKNTVPITNASGSYYAAQIDGSTCLFTENELKIAKERALKNPEDIENLNFSCNMDTERDELAEQILLKLLDRPSHVINQDAICKEASSLASKFRAINNKNEFPKNVNLGIL